MTPVPRAEPAATLDRDLLAAFEAFATTLNFTHAAKRIGISQPALFERIQRLGDRLEVPLYRRVGRALELTEQGVQVAAHAREVREHDARFLRELHGAPPEEQTTLAAGEGAYLYLLGTALRRFVRAEGALRLRLLTLGGSDACAAVASGDAHLAVCAIDIPPRGLAAEELLRTPMCVALAREHALARRRSLRVQDLAGERLILAPAGQLHRDLVGRALGRIGLDVVDPIEADGWPLMLRFAQLGLGVAFVNGSCGRLDGLVLRPLPELGTVTYRLLRRRGARLPEPAEKLARWILEAARGG